MTKTYKRFSLIGAGEGQQHHEDDATLPLVKKLQNVYLSRSDKVPSLRSDLTPDSTTLLAWSENDVGSNDDYMNTITDARSGAFTLYISRLMPFTESSGVDTKRVSVYEEGTIGNGGVSGTTITGTGTEWAQEAWTGCWLEWGSTNVARITGVASDTSLTIDTAQAIANSTSYKIYRTHNSEFADYPLNVQFWGDNIVYQATDVSQTIDKTNVSGPLQNAVSEPNYDWNDNTEYVVNTKSPDYYKTMVKMGSNYVFGASYTSDPSGSWTASTGLTASTYPYELDYAGSLGAAVASTGYLFTTADSGAAWTSRHDVNTELSSVVTGVATDGTKVVVCGTGGAIGYSAASPWSSWTTTNLTSAPYRLQAAAYDGTYWYVGGDNGIIARSEDPSDTDSWVVQYTPIRKTVFKIVTNGAGVSMAFCQNGKIVITNGTSGWMAVEQFGNDSVTSLDYDGNFFIVCKNKEIYYSETGDDWDKIKSPGTYFSAVFSDSSKTEILTATSKKRAVWHATSSSTDIVFNDFEPISDDYRAGCFSISGGYCVLGSTAEWDDDKEKWEHFPRRIRWASPGSVDDFNGEGAGFLDCPGPGAILDMRTVNQSIVTFESNAIGLLTQIGNLDSPWGYRELRAGIRIISNPIVVNNICWFVADDGLLWNTNGNSVQTIGEFDLTEYDDFDDSGPVWLDYDRTHGAFVVFKPSTGSTHQCFIISETSGAVSRFTLPQFTISGTTYKPKGVSVKHVAASTALYVHYGSLTASQSRLRSCYFNTGEVIKGIDTPVSGSTVRWYALMEGGGDRVSPEGVRASISEFELKTYADDTEGPDIIVEVRDSSDNSWQSAGDRNGTIALTGSTCVGTGTAWSNLIGVGNDVSTDFTTPCIPTQGRYYTETGGVYTELTETTDYTLTSSQVKLTSALATGTNLYVYWEAYPEVKAEAGDYIYSASDSLFHKISSITTSTVAVLESYPSGSDTGTHYNAEQMTAGQDKWSVIAVKGQVNEMRWRIYMIPRNESDASTIAKVYGFLVRYKPAGQELRKD
jgi:hypothetical protein